MDVQYVCQDDRCEVELCAKAKETVEQQEDRVPGDVKVTGGWLDQELEHGEVRHLVEVNEVVPLEVVADDRKLNERRQEQRQQRRYDRCLDWE